MEAVGEVGQLVEALGEAEPGRAAVRQQEAGPVRQLEAGSRRDIRVIWACWQRREQKAERLDGPEHQVYGSVREYLALLGRLMAESEVARDHLQQQLVHG